MRQHVAQPGIDYNNNNIEPRRLKFYNLLSCHRLIARAAPAPGLEQAAL